MPRLKNYLPIFAAVMMLGQAVPALADAPVVQLPAVAAAGWAVPAAAAGWGCHSGPGQETS